MPRQILCNAIICTSCGERIVSEHVHDFRWCCCKKVAVDGGKEYLKRWGDRKDYVEDSTYGSPMCVAILSPRMN